MKPQTVETAKRMLVMLLQQGASYAEAGKPFSLGRSTVERHVKALLRDLVADGSIKGMDEDGVTSFSLVRMASREVLAALDDHEPGSKQRFLAPLTDDHLEQAGARLRRRSQNASRDTALIAVLYQTGAKPVELARLRVDDVLTPGCLIRIEWHIREAVAFNRQCRPLHLSSPNVRNALHLYLEERIARHGRTGPADLYRGIDPRSPLFLTRRRDGFDIRPRSGFDPRETCPLMTATLRLAFRRAGWPGLTAQAVRRMAARRMFEGGASAIQIAELLGLRSARAALLLLDAEQTGRDVACPSAQLAPLPAIELAKALHTMSGPEQRPQQAA